MTKLLTAYRAAPTPANAKKLVAYVRKHSFTLCFMDAAGIATLAEAERTVDAS
jgi:hypothetical protein